MLMVTGHSADTTQTPLASFKNINKQLDEVRHEKSVLAARTAELTSKEDNLKGHLRSCFIEAIKAGDLDVVTTVLSSEYVYPNDSGDDLTGNSALHVAVLSQRPSIVRYLLSFPNIDVTPFNKENFTPLMCAIRAGFVEIIEILLKQPDIDVNFTAKYPYKHLSPIMLAVTHGQVDAVRLLLSHPKIDVSYRDRSTNKTAMICAILSGCSEIVQMLLDRPDSNPNEVWKENCGADNESILVLASRMGHTECVRALLGHPEIEVTVKDYTSYDSDDDCWEDYDYVERDTAMEEAARMGHVDILKLFLDLKKDETRLTQEQLEMIRDAARRGMLEIVRAFVECGIRITRSIDTHFLESLLVLASESGNVQLVEYILNSPKFTSRLIGRRILTGSCARKDIEMTRFLVNHPFMSFRHGTYAIFTPLIASVNANHEEGVRILLSHPKINVVEKEYHGQTALHHAAKLGNVNIIRMLISHVQVGHSTGNYSNGISSLPATVQTKRTFRAFVFLFAPDRASTRASANASEGTEAAMYFKSEERA
eukprot:972547_1